MDDTRLLAVHQTSAAPTVDVVLIHGLGGDEQSTWQSASDSDASSWWPNWLAEERPGVRIWSAGYPTTMTSWFAQTLPIPALAGNLAHRLRNQGVGDRPIVWVGHSMGGLVIKQILTDAALRSNPELKRLWLNTFAIQFRLQLCRPTHSPPDG